MVMAVRFLHERNIVVVRVIGMTQAQSRDEFVWLRNFIDRFQPAIAIDEPERLTASIRTFSFDAHGVGGPAMTALGSDAPAWRRAELEDLQRHHAMSGIYAPHRFAMLVVMMMLRQPRALLLAPGTNGNPRRDCENKQRRCDLQIGLGGVGIELAGRVQTGQGKD